MGSKNQGQGHETVFKQVLNERLGIDPNEVQYIDGDTDRVAFGIGTNGSRSTVIGGSALWIAADKIIAKGKKIAAHLLEAAEADIEFRRDGGALWWPAPTAASRSPMSRRRRSRSAKLPPGFEGGLYETGTFSPSDTTYPNGCHVCEVEIDPDTGEVEIVSYVVVDDVGTVVNPIGLKGQIHGGVAQGLGQAVMERVVYDRESGQMLSGSFMDYAMPRAADMPFMKVESNPCPTTLNPLRAPRARARPARSAHCRRSSMPCSTRWRRSGSRRSTCRRRRIGCGRRSGRRAADLALRNCTPNTPTLPSPASGGGRFAGKAAKLNWHLQSAHRRLR